ncbi:hypothetical protein GPECTOR_40g611 [Gonium pectorale]|uniref:PAS domain-containing protein n=1 Tax=Gonium pectorale TaxID=33097 RepID=A0A150GAK3_GONPE|nr:hypothetical protein GPECTOR_40g611 [Gonium pectorale]|eukprot:KXZ46877.1 hypothetical protein GPECTOR_40g611 [Gonium pectorale]
MSEKMSNVGSMRSGSYTTGSQSETSSQRSDSKLLRKHKRAAEEAEEGDLLEQKRTFQEGIFACMYTLVRQAALNNWKWALVKVVLEGLMPFIVVFNPSADWVIRTGNPVWQVVRWTVWRSPVMRIYGYDTYIRIMYVMAAAVVAAVVGLVWLTIAMRSQEQSKWLRRAAAALHIVYEFLFVIFYVSFTDYFVFVANCDFTSAAVEHAYFKGVKCLQMPHVLHMSLGLCAACLHLAVTALLVVASSDLNPVSRGRLASPDAYSRLKILAAKARARDARAAFIMVADDLQSWAGLQTVLLNMAAGAICWWNFRKLPFYRPVINVAWSSMWVAVLYTTLLHTVLVFDKNQSEERRRRYTLGAGALPANGKLLRCYGKFLEDVRHDPLAAARAYGEAARNGGGDAIAALDLSAVQGAPGKPEFLTSMSLAEDAVVVINMEGTIMMVSQAVQRVFGYAKAELEGANVSVLMPQPFSQRHPSYLARYASTGEPHILDSVREVLALHKDRYVFPMALCVTRMSGAGADRPAYRSDPPDPIGPPPLLDLSVFIGVLRPLATSTLRTRAWLAPNGTFLSGDQQFASLCGMPEKELIGRSLASLVANPEADVASLLEAFRGASAEALEAGLLRHQLLLKHRFLEPVPVEVTLGLGGTDGQRILAMRVQRTDGQEGSLMVVDNHMRLRFASLGVAAMLNYPMRRLAGMRLDELLPPPYNTLHAKWLRLELLEDAAVAAEEGLQGAAGFPSSFPAADTDGDGQAAAATGAPILMRVTLWRRDLLSGVVELDEGLVVRRASLMTGLIVGLPAGAMQRKPLARFLDLPEGATWERLAAAHSRGKRSALKASTARHGAISPLMAFVGPHPDMGTMRILVQGVQGGGGGGGGAGGKVVATLHPDTTFVGAHANLLRALHLEGVAGGGGGGGKGGTSTAGPSAAVSRVGTLAGRSERRLTAAEERKDAREEEEEEQERKKEQREDGGREGGKEAEQNAEEDEEDDNDDDSSSDSDGGDGGGEGVDGEARAQAKMLKKASSKSEFVAQWVRTVSQQALQLSPAPEGAELGGAAAADGAEPVAGHKPLTPPSAQQQRTTRTPPTPTQPPAERQASGGGAGGGGAQLTLAALGDGGGGSFGASRSGRRQLDRNESMRSGRSRLARIEEEDALPATGPGGAPPTAGTLALLGGGGGGGAKGGGAAKGRGGGDEDDGVGDKGSDAGDSSVDGSQAASGITSITDAQSVFEVAVDARRSRLLRSLQKLLCGPLLAAPLQRLRLHSYGLLALMLAAHVGCYVAITRAIDKEHANIYLVDKQAMAMDRAQLIVVRVLIGTYCERANNTDRSSACTPPLSVHINNMVASILTQEQNHQDVYLGFSASHVRYPDAAVYDVWTQPRWRYDVFMDTNPPSVLSVNTGVWQLGNRFLAAAREALYWMPALRDKFRHHRVYQFLVTNGLGGLFEGYATSLDLLMDSAWRSLDGLRMVLIVLLVVEVCVVQLCCLAYEALLVSRVEGARLLGVAAMMALPGPVLRQLAGREIKVLDDSDDDDDDDDESVAAAEDKQAKEGKEGEKGGGEKGGGNATAEKAAVAFSGGAAAGDESDADGAAAAGKPPSRKKDAQVPPGDASAAPAAPAGRPRRRGLNLLRGGSTGGLAHVLNGKALIASRWRVYKFMLLPGLWFAALLAVYGVSLLQLSDMQGPLASLNMCSHVTYRYTRVRAVGFAFLSQDDKPSRDLWREVLRNEVRLFTSEYNALMYGGTALSQANSQFQHAVPPSTFASASFAEAFFKTKRCFRFNQTLCAKPGSPYYEVTHNGLDVMVRRMITEMELLIADADEDVRYNATRWTFMYNVGTFDLYEGLQQAAQLFVDYSIGRYKTVAQMHSILLAATVLVFAAYVFLTLWPHMAKLRGDALRQSALLSRVPPEVDTLGHVRAVCRRAAAAAGGGAGGGGRRRARSSLMGGGGGGGGAGAAPVSV